MTETVCLSRAGMVPATLHVLRRGGLRKKYADTNRGEAGVYSPHAPRMHVCVQSSPNSPAPPKHHETTPSTTKHKQHHPRIALSIKLVGMCTFGSHASRPRGERQTNDGVLRWRCGIILLVRALLQSCGTDLVIPTAKVAQHLLRVSRSAAGTLSVG